MKLLRETLQELAPARLLAQQIERQGSRLLLPPAPPVAGGASEAQDGGAEYDLGRYRQRLVLALGKAAVPMLNAWRELAATQSPGPAWDAIIVSADPRRAAPVARNGSLQQFFGGHPEPNADSRAGAEAMLAAARGLQPPALLVALVSGGGSAMAESPLQADWSLLEMQELYRQLVRCGAPIGEINSVRKHLSRFKGGRLAEAAAELDGVDQLSLLLSDVPPGEADSISSGPTLPDRSRVEDCYRIYAQRQLRLPARMAAMLEGKQLAETPKPEAACFRRARWRVVGDNALACEMLARRARAHGLAAVIEHGADEADYREAAARLLQRWRELRRETPNACLIAGGEVRVAVPEEAGQGGRNQAFALECARRLMPEEEGCIASLGTDGVDGSSPAAGAIVDATTRERARRANFDLEQAAAKFDAYPLLAAIGDAIETGPTGNNLRDLRLLL